VFSDALVHVPYTIARVFVVRASSGAKRGDHAHKRCSQFMICVSGAVEVTCDDGFNGRSFALARADTGLLIPPGIWTTLHFDEAGVVIVLCDRFYEAEDYIRCYDEFLSALKKTTC
jgi:mannose-6-phosphate isomerase-like protein (cupin superfamily)